MPPVGFELTISAGERPQTYALDRAATGTSKHLWYPAKLFVEWEIFQTKFIEKIETHFIFNNFFSPRKSYLLWGNVEKYDTAGQATDDNMAHAQYVLYN
jgi:hypothetical protein